MVDTINTLYAASEHLHVRVFYLFIDDLTRNSEQPALTHLIKVSRRGEIPPYPRPQTKVAQQPMTRHSLRAARTGKMRDEVSFRCSCAKVGFRSPPLSGRHVAGWHPDPKLRHARNRISCEHFATEFCDSQPLEIIHPQKPLQNRSVLRR